LHLNGIVVCHVTSKQASANHKVPMTVIITAKKDNASGSEIPIC